MKTYILAIAALLSFSCNGQQDEANKAELHNDNKHSVQEPKGSWSVEKAFDEKGNLIKYDSIYSWSSHGSTLKNLSTLDRDSLMQSFRSRFFTNFSDFDNTELESVFTQDSLFDKRFFSDDFFKSDFGKDFMDIDAIRQQMILKQNAFLEKYHSDLLRPKPND